MMILRANAVVTGNEVVDDCWIVIEEGLITGIGTGNAPVGQELVLEGILVPGFVDIHCHGGSGYSFDDPYHAKSVANFHLSHGTTSVMASLVSAPIIRNVELLHALTPMVDDGTLIGVHLEGPFLAHAHCGAQNPAHLMDPSPLAVAALIEAGDDCLAMVTIAPELEGAMDAIAQFKRAGVVVALGHSGANADQTAAACDAGATVITHLNNGMLKYGKSELSIGDYALTEPRLFAELISDGIHLDDEFVRKVVTSMPSRYMAITDAMVAAGMPDGDYELGGLAVTAKDGAARLSGTTTLAGSTLTMDRAFGYLLDRIGLDLVAAVAATSTTPARAVGLTRTGKIEIGFAADLVLWNGKVEGVWKRGERRA